MLPFRVFCLGAVYLAAMSPTLAQDYDVADVSTSAIETVQAALDRGYGGMCSLSFTVVPTGGYYRCIDMGPYRFVAEYGKLSGFVLTSGGQPFPILSSSEGRSQFLVSGPWLQDLAPRIQKWWDDEIGGGRQAREAREAQSRKAQEAAANVQHYMDQDDPPSPSAPAPDGYAPPPSYSVPLAAAPQAMTDTPARPLAQPPAPPSGAQLDIGVPGMTQEPGSGLTAYPNGYKPPWLK